MSIWPWPPHLTGIPSERGDLGRNRPVPGEDGEAAGSCLQCLRLEKSLAPSRDSCASTPTQGNTHGEGHDCQRGVREQGSRMGGGCLPGPRASGGSRTLCAPSPDLKRQGLWRRARGSSAPCIPEPCLCQRARHDPRQWQAQHPPCLPGPFDVGVVLPRSHKLALIKSLGKQEVAVEPLISS